MYSNRSRAWRRALHARSRAKHSRKHRTKSLAVEKSWKLMYLRSEKLWRAHKTGMIWPHRHWRKLLEDAKPLNVLFVCSQNKWRIPTAEQIWRKVADVSVRSAGTSRNARRSITLADIRWADLILVMEDKHKARICAEFRGDVSHKAIHVLDIPDDYRFMDPELIEIIREQSEPLIFGALEET